MDTQAFLKALDGEFEGDPGLGVPSDPRFAAVADDVTGFTTPAELAVLNLAARMLPDGEAYLEVGTFKGRSLCGALVDAPPRRFVAVENFMEFGMLGADARAELQGNLARYAEGRDGVALLDGDCFKLLARPGAAGNDPVGVYFYDGAHTGMAHYLALGVVEPLLADEALILVDDASWPMVEKATLKFVREHPGWVVLRSFAAVENDDPRWANGLMVLAFNRPVGADPARRRLGLESRRVVQVYVRGPATGVVWRTLHRFPGLVPLAKRLVPKRSRSVESSGGNSHGT